MDVMHPFVAGDGSCLVRPQLANILHFMQFMIGHNVLIHRSDQ